MKYLFCLFILTIAGKGFSQEIDYERLGMDVESHRTPVGLQVGDRVPSIHGTDQDGTEVLLNDLLAKGPVVLIFYRGEWCGICNRYLSRFQDSLEMLTSLGASVLAVTLETPDHARNMMEKTSAGLAVISDTNGKIMEAFDVMFKVTDAYVARIESSSQMNIAENNGMDEAYLPVPATYIIDSSGEIIYRHFDPVYRYRASIAKLIQVLTD